MCVKSKNHSPFVTVIIPTYNDWNRLDKCLLALSNQTYLQKNFEVVVINNNSLDAAPENIKKYNFTMHTENKPGSYASRNKGICIAKGDILAFTDSDCIPNLYWIERAVDAKLGR